MIGSATGDGAGGGSTAPLCVAELTELGRNVPDGEAGMSIEDGIDVPSLSCRYGHQGLVARLPPRTDVLSSLLESPSQRIGCLLVEAVEGVAVDIVPHFGLVDVVGSGLLCVPEHLVRHLDEDKILM